MALTSMLAFASLQLLISTQEESGRLINVSGRQRMLSQRITLLATEYATDANEPRRAETRRLLAQTVSEFRSAHRALTQGDASFGIRGKISPAMREIYEDPRAPLNEYISEFLSKVDALMAGPPGAADALVQARELSRLARYVLLDRLNDVVTQYEREADAQVRVIERLELVVFIVTIFALFGEGLFIFRPLAREITERTEQLQRARDQLSHSATHDELTGLPNRRHLREYASAWAARSRDRERPGAVMQLDLDGFKRVNDTLGHGAGDELLRQVADRLREELREGDFVARLGGDEFVVLLASMKLPGDYAPVAERLVERLRQPFTLDGQVARIGASIGVAATAEGAVQFDRLMSHADLALYEAKRRGKGNWQLFRSDATAADALGDPPFGDATVLTEEVSVAPDERGAA